MCFEDLIKKLSPRLKRITYKMNGHFSFLNDEDLFQEALIHLWEDFKAGELDNKTDSYILQGCYFHLKNYLRKVNKKARLVSLDAIVNEDEPSLGEMLFIEDKTARDYFDDLNREILLEEFLNSELDWKERNVFLLHLEGLTTREIGRKIDASHVWVVKLMDKIRQKCSRYREITFRNRTTVL